MTPTITSVRADDVTIVTMDDGRVNALTFEMFDQLHRSLDQAEADGDAIVLTGRPGTFSAGFHLPTLTSGTESTPRLLQAGFELAARMLVHPRPIVAACSGHAFAMGTFLLMASDLRLGVSGGDHRIAANEVAIGLTMPRAALAVCGRLNPAHFGRAMIQAETFDPESAVAAGFLDDVTAEPELVDVAVDRARGMGNLPREAFAATKARVQAPQAEAVRRSVAEDVAEIRSVFGLA